jgi:hypothetical protein
MEKRVFAGLLLGCLFAADASAAISPTFTSFGTLAGADFGGDGIANDAVAITTIINGGNTITLGLTAFGRYENLQPTNDGAGTFTAAAGANTGMDVVAHSLGTTWNFGYYVNIQAPATGNPVVPGNFGSYTVDLLYDLKPAAGTSVSDLGIIHLNSFVPNTTTNVQDSQNLLFAFLAGIPPISGVVPPPGFPPAIFDPNATGEYTFALRVTNNADPSMPIGQAAIQVNVQSAEAADIAVPEPSGLIAMLGLFGTAGLFGFCGRRGWSLRNQ